MATALYNTPRLKPFVVSEASNQRSRSEVVVAQTGAAIASGTVLGKITASGKYKPYASGASDGSQTAVGVLYQALPAATGDVKVVIFDGDCELNRHELTGLDAAAETALAARGIKIRGKATLGISTPAL